MDKTIEKVHIGQVTQKYHHVIERVLRMRRRDLAFESRSVGEII